MCGLLLMLLASKPMPSQQQHTAAVRIYNRDAITTMCFPRSLWRTDCDAVRWADRPYQFVKEATSNRIWLHFTMQDESIISFPNRCQTGNCVRIIPLFVDASFD